MSIDRHAVERRRFARLLGIDGELGSGLPIGDGDDRDRHEDESNAKVTSPDR